MPNITKEDLTTIELVLTEGFFTSDKLTFWPEELEALFKLYSKFQKFEKKYLDAAKRLGKDELLLVSLEYAVKIDSTLSRIIKKKTRGTSKITLSLRDGNGMVPKMLKNGIWDDRDTKYTIAEESLIIKIR